MRVCSAPSCPELYPKAEGKHCATHRTAANKTRGPRSERGYDTEHDRLRRKWAPVVARGRTNCARCHELIAPHTAWDLGHTDNHDAYNGPEHARCNRSAAGIKSHS